MPEVFVILDPFSLIDRLNTLKNQNFEKMRKQTNKQTKTPREITMCTIHENQMMYGS